MPRMRVGRIEVQQIAFGNNPKGVIDVFELDGDGRCQLIAIGSQNAQLLRELLLAAARAYPDSVFEVECSGGQVVRILSAGS